MLSIFRMLYICLKFWEMHLLRLTLHIIMCNMKLYFVICQTWNSIMAFFKDCSFSTFIIKKMNDWTKKTMNGWSVWINGLFERPNGLTSCIFFHEWNEWKNMLIHFSSKNFSVQHNIFIRMWEETPVLAWVYEFFYRKRILF